MAAEAQQEQAAAEVAEHARLLAAVPPQGLSHAEADEAADKLQDQTITPVHKRQKELDALFAKFETQEQGEYDGHVLDGALRIRLWSLGCSDSC